jgi:hypothetical protein
VFGIYFILKPRPKNRQDGVHNHTGVQLERLVDRTHRTRVRRHRVLRRVAADMRRTNRDCEGMCGTSFATGDTRPDSAEYQVRQMGRSV